MFPKRSNIRNLKVRSRCACRQLNSACRGAWPACAVTATRPPDPSQPTNPHFRLIGRCESSRLSCSPCKLSQCLRWSPALPAAAALRWQCSRTCAHRGSCSSGVGSGCVPSQRTVAAGLEGAPAATCSSEKITAVLGTSICTVGCGQGRRAPEGRLQQQQPRRRQLTHPDGTHLSKIFHLPFLPPAPFPLPPLLQQPETSP